MNADFPSAARALLAELAARPYENLSKIVAFHRSGSAETAQDVSARGLGDADSGFGGTCFSLTHWLKTRLEALGFSTAYLMADKRIEPNVHCGLLFERGAGAERRLYLLDPGYLIFEPLPLPDSGLSYSAFLSPNEVRVDDISDAGVWRLFTGPRGALKHRFDFRKQPVTPAEFERHWEASHHWPMMHYPVLNRVHNGTQYYLQKNNLLVRSATQSDMKKLTEEEIRGVARELFSLPPDLVDEAFALLKNKG